MKKQTKTRQINVLDSANIWPGWCKIISDLHTEMLRIDRHYEIDQIKEKFGGLRYYYHTPLRKWERLPLLNLIGLRRRAKRMHKMDSLVERAVALCWQTCERCGSDESVKTERLANSYWIKTLCQSCRGEADADSY